MSKPSLIKKERIKILDSTFYKQNTLLVAQNLLGNIIVRQISDGSKRREIRGLITEVEAYMGTEDLASHASKGRTRRTELMHGQAGYAYVYMIYGMYHCFNIVTEKKDFPAAVLIRGIKIENIDYKKTNGPGKICKILQIDREINGLDITKGKKLWIEKGIFVSADKIERLKRIGVDYAKHCKDYLWRFRINSEFIEKK